ncbi:CAP domain-containing protein [Herbidospora cretacea]|uniref:CAP domain-containing protein n=1 Tax=Herbidospora cretacea TaxID=28444 RepID=UPI0007737EBA|nr:CAP domain-containing protein [Herbidospora cretacea]
MIKHLVIAAAAALAPVLVSALPASADVIPATATALHNEARAFYGVGPVQWDGALREETRAYARICRFEPSAHGDRYGENLYVTTAQDDDATVLRDAVVAWATEAMKFDKANHRHSRDVSHYTQTIGANTDRMAVAIADCPAGSIFGSPTKFVVARYIPGQDAVKAAL